MEQIIRKIDRILNGIENKEKHKILDYYREIISDRLENGENIESIDKNIDYDSIKLEYFTKSISSYEKKAIKKNTSLSLRLLAYLFTSPFWIPLAIVYFIVILVMYILVAAAIIVLVSIPFAIIGFFYNQIISDTNLAELLFASGVLLLGYGVISITLLNIVKVIMNLNMVLIKGIIKLISKKGTKTNENNI